MMALHKLCLSIHSAPWIHGNAMVHTGLTCWSVRGVAQTMPRITSPGMYSHSDCKGTEGSISNFVCFLVYAEGGSPDPPLYALRSKATVEICCQHSEACIPPSPNTRRNTEASPRRIVQGQHHRLVPQTELQMGTVDVGIVCVLTGDILCATTNANDAPW